MDTRILGKYLLSALFVLAYGCSDETVPFTEETVGSYDISSVVEESNDPAIKTFPIDDEPSADAMAPVDELFVDDGSPAMDSPADADPDSVADFPRANGIGKKNSNPGKGHNGKTDETSGDAATDDATGGVADNGGSHSPNQGGISDDPYSEGMDDAALAKACGKHFRGKAKQIAMLSGEGGKVSVGPETVLAVRVSGNQRTLQLNFAAGEKIAGLCVFAAGNQPRIAVNSALDMKALVYVARGNSTSGTIHFDGNSVDESVIDLGGNSQTLAISGLGSEPCDSANVKGNGHMLTCE